jgi:hypothetical protein
MNPAVPFSWTASASALGYRLMVGTTIGAIDLLDTGEITSTSRLVNTLPSNATLFARISTHTAAGWQSQDVQFTTTRGAYLTSPTDGAVIGVACAPFTWTPAAGALAYYLYVGTSQGAKDIVDFGETQATSMPGPSLPANRPLHGRIWTKFASAWTWTDVQFTAAQAALTYPVANASGIGTGGSFQWTTVPGVQKYYLYVGDTPGSNNRINSGEITQTTYPMAGLPVGTTLYAQIWTKVNGCWTAAPAVPFRP